FAAAWRAARRAEFPSVTTIGWCLGVGFLALGLLLTAVLLQVAILFAGALIAGFLDRDRQWLRPLSVLAVLIGYGVVGWSVIAREQQYAGLGERYPMESLDDRLPRKAPDSVGGDADRLARLEQSIQSEGKGWRQAALARLHAGTVRRFTNSPGFGTIR